MQIDNYYAYEVDKYAIQTVKHNFPNIQELGDVFNADFKQYEGIDYLIGGSPCVFWSIAQSPNKRETTASGMGWELFSQYVRALNEAKPKYFIYENNKSMAKAIYNSISETFGFEPIMINSALVSAQNRQRLYWVGKRNPNGTYSKVDVKQPEDRGIVLKDVLDGMVDRRTSSDMTFDPVNITQDGKSQTIKAQYSHTDINNICKYTSTYGAGGVAEPVNVTLSGKCQCIRATCYKDGIRNLVGNTVDRRTAVAEPVAVAQRGRYESGKTEQHIESRTDGKSNCITTVQKDSMIAEPIRCFTLPREDGVQTQSKQYRVYAGDGKSTTLCAEGGGMGAKTGLYAVPIKVGEVGNGGQGNRIYTADGKAVTQQANSGGLGSHTGLYAIPVEFENDKPIKAVSGTDGKTYKVYGVTNGMITIKDKTYPIKIQDGLYIIRKLTVSECKRLQTVPEWYEFPVSNTQCYRLLGNGWTCDVITHLIKATLN